MHLDLTEVLVALIGAISSYLVGHRVGRRVHRSGDYVPKDLLK